MPNLCVKSRVSAISDVLRCLWWARPLEPNKRGGGVWGRGSKAPPSSELHPPFWSVTIHTATSTPAHDSPAPAYPTLRVRVCRPAVCARTARAAQSTFLWPRGHGKPLHSAIAWDLLERLSVVSQYLPCSTGQCVPPSYNQRTEDAAVSAPPIPFNRPDTAIGDHPTDVDSPSTAGSVRQPFSFP